MTALADIQNSVAEIGASWATDRPQRQSRRHLDRADFDALRDAGILTLCVPKSMGGTWLDAQTSVRSVCEIYRRLAGADPSVALVSAMHPAVVGFWLASPDESQPQWEAQRQAVFASALTGEQWGTITSEPGSGGDIARTKSVAMPLEGEGLLPGLPYAVSGDKHFGSGSGITDWMMTTAVPQGESPPTIFAFDVRGRAWDGTAGLTLLAEWDGAGMAATQSHAIRLEEIPAIRLAFDGKLETITGAANPFIWSLFTAVILGILDVAVETARTQIRARAAGLRAYEQVEWSRAELDHWVAVQAYEGALRAIEAGEPAVAFHAAIRAKQAVAELAEQTLNRISRALGGGTFSHRSPFAHWFEDVRALGFLRPPWGFAYDTLFTTSIE